jgi:hypothetical protein
VVDPTTPAATSRQEICHCFNNFARQAARETGLRHPDGGHNLQEEAMSIFTALGTLATQYRTARSRYLTERQVRSLPAEIQKDIGWPEAHDPRTTEPRIWVGTWS